MYFRGVSRGLRFLRGFAVRKPCAVAVFVRTCKQSRGFRLTFIAVLRFREEYFIFLREMELDRYYFKRKNPAVVRLPKCFRRHRLMINLSRFCTGLRFSP